MGSEGSSWGFRRHVRKLQRVSRGSEGATGRFQGVSADLSWVTWGPRRLQGVFGGISGSFRRFPVHFRDGIETFPWALHGSKGASNFFKHKLDLCSQVSFRAILEAF